MRSDLRMEVARRRGPLHHTFERLRRLPELTHQPVNQAKFFEKAYLG